MKKLLVAFLMMFCVAHLAIAGVDNLKPYQKGDWSSLLKTAKGVPMAIHFWGVTCAPCVKEMPQWGKFAAVNKNANLIFIQVDDVSPEMIQKMLDKANLGHAKNYYVSSAFDEQLRHEIDPKWRGETPITILIDKNGKAIRKTGPINFSQLESLLRP
jgi:thiol-disulfide isomerase/thioredoxin